MIKGITESGFNFEIPEENFDDYEVLELLYKLDNEENQTVIVKLAPMILGDEQFNKLKEHVRGKNGRVRLSAMISELSDIMNFNTKTKN